MEKYRTSYSENNNLGLLLVIKTQQQKKKMLFSGDCEYIQFPTKFLKPYDNLVVPNHGAKVKYDDLNQIMITKKGLMVVLYFV